MPVSQISIQLSTQALNSSRLNPRRREENKLNFYFHISLRCLKKFYHGVILFGVKSVYGALSKLSYLWYGGCLKVINWGWWRWKSQKGGSFHREGRFFQCDTAILWNFIVSCIYCKIFHWITLFTMLLLCYVFEVGKARSTTQSVLMKHRMGYSRKILKFFILPLNSHYP